MVHLFLSLDLRSPWLLEFFPYQAKEEFNPKKDSSISMCFLVEGFLAPSVVRLYNFLMPRNMSLITFSYLFTLYRSPWFPKSSSTPPFWLFSLFSLQQRLKSDNVRVSVFGSNLNSLTRSLKQSMNWPLKVCWRTRKFQNDLFTISSTAGSIFSDATSVAGSLVSEGVSGASEIFQTVTCESYFISASPKPLEAQALGSNRWSGFDRRIIRWRRSFHTCDWRYWCTNHCRGIGLHCCYWRDCSSDLTDRVRHMFPFFRKKWMLLTSLGKL